MTSRLVVLSVYALILLTASTFAHGPPIRLLPLSDLLRTIPVHRSVRVFVMLFGWGGWAGTSWSSPDTWCQQGEIIFGAPDHRGRQSATFGRSAAAKTL